MNTIIVSRHPAAVSLIARELGGIPSNINNDGMPMSVCLPGAPAISWGSNSSLVIAVLPQASASDVRGKHVYGNLPLHLAALAAKVTVVEFRGTPPRGQEYSLADMEAAGAVLRSYVVAAAVPEGHCQHCGGAGGCVGDGVCHAGPYASVDSGS